MIKQYLDDEALARALQIEEDHNYCDNLQKKEKEAVDKQEIQEIQQGPESNVKIDFTRGFISQTIDKIKEKTAEEEYNEDEYFDDYYPLPDDIVVSGSMKKYQTQANKIQKYSGRINLHTIEHGVQGQMKKFQSKQLKNQIRRTDISDKATVENVMDNRTRIIIFKLINRNMIGSINGCVSTGKEANVYYAISNDRENEFAIKVYKTSILKFKDRTRYVEGEFRFQRFCSGNPRKMVKIWAEKEMRNLKRLEQAKITCPKVFFIRQHVLGMEFIGKNGVAAPLLKHTDYSPKRYLKIYRKVMKIMRQMFQVAKLIHADFSEYNLLYYKSKVVVIDVSQSVEFDHPNAMVFLKMDCTNIRNFFVKRTGNDNLLNVRQMFEFITAKHVGENMDFHIKSIIKENTRKIKRKEDKINDSVFQGSNEPTKIEELDDSNFDAFKDAFIKGKDERGIRKKKINKRKNRKLIVIEGVNDGTEKKNNEKEKKKEKKEEQKEEQNPNEEVIVIKEKTSEKDEKEEGEKEGEGEKEESEGEGEEEESEEIKELRLIMAKIEESGQSDIAEFLKNLPKNKRKKLVKLMKKEKRKTKVKKNVKKRRKKVAKRGNKRNRKNK